MNETTLNSPERSAPAATGERRSRKSTGNAFLAWLLEAIPTALVLVGLAALAYGGHHTGWKLPKYAELMGHGAAANDDWCAEHGVLESGCVECKPELFPKVKSFGWCKRHGVHECPLCHPEVAQLKTVPTLSQGDLDKAQQALDFAERPENNKKCKLHERRIQFVSKEAVEKAGVDVAPVVEAPMLELVSGNGEIGYDQTRVARLAARVPGTVWRVEKEVGEPVKRGDILALIDAAEVGKVKAEFLQSLVLVDLKAKTLDGQHSAAAALSERQVREAEAALREARIRLVGAEQALINLGFSVRAEDFKGVPDNKLASRIQFLGLPAALVRTLATNETTANLIPLRAPLDGVVVAREAVVGEVVDSQKMLFVIASLDRMWLTLDVRQEDARRIALGQEVRFPLDGDEARSSVTGQIAWISTEVDDKTRTVKVRANLDNRSRLLRAHAFGTGSVVLRAVKNATVVPNDALHWEGCCHVVFVRDKDFFREDAPKVFHTRTVRPGAKDGNSTEIIAGLLPGEVVAARGSGVLRAELLKNNLGAG